MNKRSLKNLFNFRYGILEFLNPLWWSVILFNKNKLDFSQIWINQKYKMARFDLVWPQIKKLIYSNKYISKLSNTSKKFLHISRWETNFGTFWVSEAGKTQKSWKNKDFSLTLYVIFFLKLTLARKAQNMRIFNYLEKDFRLIDELCWPRILKIQFNST